MKQLEIRFYQNQSKFYWKNEINKFNRYFRTKFERKQIDDSEPIQTSRVVTDEVKSKF